MHQGWGNLAGYAVKENGRVLKVEMTTELSSLPSIKIGTGGLHVQCLSTFGTLPMLNAALHPLPILVPSSATALQLRDVNERWVRQELGIVGLRLVWELRGISCLPLALCPPPNQSLMVSQSFGRPITTLIEMREAVATYMTRAAEKLRRSCVAAGVLTVFLTTNRFADEPQYSNSVTMPLPVATQDTAELIRYALRGVEQLFRGGYRYQKAGVILTALVPAHQIQAHLFDQHDRERSQKLMAAIDTINTEWGSGTIRYAAVGLRPAWIMRCARRSPRYTTRWEELAVVR